jgi:hypothetical protein
VGSLTSAASAASASDQSSSTTRLASLNRCFGVSRVTVELHPVSFLGLVALTPPASKEARMNKVVSFYT